MFPVILGLALAAAQVVKGIVDKNKASKIKTQFTPYEASPYAAAQLQTAQQMMNGRMAGAATEERNIDQSEAGFNNYLDRNASSGSQKLALAAEGMSSAQGAYSNLQMKEQQNKYGLLANLNQAYQGMTRENDKVYESKYGKYVMDMNTKQALNNSGDQNIFGGISSGIGMMSSMGSGGSGGGGMSNFRSASMVQPNSFNTLSQSPAAAYGNYIPQSGSLNLPS